VAIIVAVGVVVVAVCCFIVVGVVVVDEVVAVVKVKIPNQKRDLCSAAARKNTTDIV